MKTVLEKTQGAGMPGLRGLDHVGFTVPDLKQAVDFFVDVMGCDASFQLGPFKADDDWMQEHLNVDPRAEIPRIQLVRCGNGANLEIFEFKAPNQVQAPPKNSDVGGHHLGFYVDDMEKSIAYLKERDVKILGEPSVFTEGPNLGLTWIYALTPWGMQIELVSYPRGRAYEKTAERLLWDPRSPAK